MKKTVMMPVIAMGEKCINCPELEIDIFTRESYDLEALDDVRTKVKTKGYENTLRCKHCDRCQVLEDLINEATKEVKEPKKTSTRKTSTRKAAAKK